MYRSICEFWQLTDVSILISEIYISLYILDNLAGLDKIIDMIYLKYKI